MNAFRRSATSRLAVGAAFVLPLLLTGCSLFPTTRKLPIPKPPTVEQTLSPDALVSELNQRWESLNTLTATVEIQATVTKSKEGKATDYPSVHGNILIRKPGALRVLGRYLGLLAFDMASDGKDFVLSIPQYKKAIKGSNNLKKKSDNAFENLRPKFFMDAMMVRGVEKGDRYTVTQETFTVEDAARKHLYSVPEYVLRINRPKGGSSEDIPVRVVHFHRDDLRPYQQDVYDSEGKLETQVFYAAYQDFDSANYPSRITIKCPQEEIEINLTVDRVIENQVLKDDQFVVAIPEGATVQNLD